MIRRLSGEALGTGLLLYVIVGSGIAAETLSADPGARLFAHAIAVGIGLGALIAFLQPVSGSHFNPSVTIAFWGSKAMPALTAVGYVAAQLIGAVLGVAAANASFGLQALAVASTARSGPGVLMSEGVATFVLVVIVVGMVRAGRETAVPMAVGAWVASAVFATASTGFANPAVTVARTLTDSYAGIAPASVPGFVAVQLLAGIAALFGAVILFPKAATQRLT